MTENVIAVIGVGYVGLTLAAGLARYHKNVFAYDKDRSRIGDLKKGVDRNLSDRYPITLPSTLVFTNDLMELKNANVYIITVPTPIDSNRRPDLSLLQTACQDIAKVIDYGNLVILESTVYPGVTEEACGPWIETLSGLKQGSDFCLGYSPERINPGDEENTLEKVVKIVSGQDSETLNRLVEIYEPIVKAGLFRAPSIKIAEAAKVVENVQRDLNIALMNELSFIFDRMEIRTADVIEAAATKWNFQHFTPGLVGGHCVGIDPYYLISKAEELGYYPEVIRAARRLNDGLSDHVAQRTLSLVLQTGVSIREARIGVLGLTFKENVSDLRNSQSPKIVHSLMNFGARVLAHDPHIEAQKLKDEYQIDLSPWDEVLELDALLIIVPHKFYLTQTSDQLFGKLKSNGVLLDIKSAIDPSSVPDSLRYWSL